MTSFDDRELRSLTADFSVVTSKTLPTARAVVEEGAIRLRDEWKENAKATSGGHGKHYPDSITASAAFSTDIAWEIGPDVTRKQGSMGPGFEYGSVNQPAHLDGNRAADKVGPVVERMLALGVEDLF